MARWLAPCPSYVLSGSAFAGARVHVCERFVSLTCPFPRTLIRPVRHYASVIIRRFSSNCALSISPRAKRSFKISIAVREVSRVSRLSLLRRRGPIQTPHARSPHSHSALAPLMWIDVWSTSRASSPISEGGRAQASRAKRKDHSELHNAG